MWPSVLDNLPETGLPWSQLAVAVNHPYDQHQLKVCRVVLNRISPTTVPSNEQEAIATKVLLGGQTEVFLLTFNTWTSISSASWKRDFLHRVVETWIYKENFLLNLLLSHCQPKANHLSGQLIKVLTTLPDLVANSYKLSIPRQFCADEYFKRLCRVILKACDVIHGKLGRGESSSTVTLSSFIGRISFLGHSDILWLNLLEPIVQKSTSDMAFRRITLKLMHHQQDLHLEPLVRVILANCVNCDEVDCLLSDAINRKDKLEYLLTEKFVLISYTYSQRSAPNLVGYLAKHNTNLLLKVVNTCLDIWCSKSAIENRSVQQNLYIYSLLLHSFNFLSQDEVAKHSGKWFKVLVKGVEVYLNQVTLDIRNCGLFVGNCLMSKVQPGCEPLKFDIEDDVNVTFLKKCLKIQCEEVNDAINHEKNARLCKDQPLIEELKCDDTSRLTQEVNAGSTVNHGDLDLPCDTKKPKYLNDCLEGLGDTDNYEWGQECLRCCRNLILSNSFAAKELAIDIASKLLHLTNETDSDEFVVNRIDSLVAICTLAPGEVASFLVDKFYDKNFSLATRMDILRVLGMAAVQIAFGVSSTAKSKACASTTASTTVPMDTIEAIEETWGVNDSHLCKPSSNGKSRKLTTATKFITGKKNPFTPFAETFFYPLIEKFDGRQVLLTIDSFDCHLLVNLVFTLGIILHTSSQIWESRRMARTLLPFICPLMTHKEPSVRRAVLFAFTNVLTSVPSVYLFQELNSFIELFKTWLIQVMEEDLDSECKMAAQKCVYVLNDLIDIHNTRKNEG